MQVTRYQFFAQANRNVENSTTASKALTEIGLQKLSKGAALSQLQACRQAIQRQDVSGLETSIRQLAAEVENAGSHLTDGEVSQLRWFLVSSVQPDHIETTGKEIGNIVGRILGSDRYEHFSAQLGKELGEYVFEALPPTLQIGQEQNSNVVDWSFSRFTADNVDERAREIEKALFDGPRVNLHGWLERKKSEIAQLLADENLKGDQLLGEFLKIKLGDISGSASPLDKQYAREQIAVLIGVLQPLIHFDKILKDETLKRLQSVAPGKNLLEIADDFIGQKGSARGENRQQIIECLRNDPFLVALVTQRRFEVPFDHSKPSKDAVEAFESLEGTFKDGSYQGRKFPMDLTARLSLVATIDLGKYQGLEDLVIANVLSASNGQVHFSKVPFPRPKFDVNELLSLGPESKQAQETIFHWLSEKVAPVANYGLALAIDKVLENFMPNPQFVAALAEFSRGKSTLFARRGVESASRNIADRLISGTAHYRYVEQYFATESAIMKLLRSPPNELPSLTSKYTKAAKSIGEWGRDSVEGFFKGVESSAESLPGKFHLLFELFKRRPEWVQELVPNLNKEFRESMKQTLLDDVAASKIVNPNHISLVATICGTIEIKPLPENSDAPLLDLRPGTRQNNTIELTISGGLVVECHPSQVPVILSAHKTKGRLGCFGNKDGAVTYFKHFASNPDLQTQLLQDFVKNFEMFSDNDLDLAAALFREFPGDLSTLPDGSDGNTIRLCNVEGQPDSRRVKLTFLLPNPDRQLLWNTDYAHFETVSKMIEAYKAEPTSPIMSLLAGSFSISDMLNEKFQNKGMIVNPSSLQDQSDIGGCIYRYVNNWLNLPENNQLKDRILEICPDPDDALDFIYNPPEANKALWEELRTGFLKHVNE